MDNDRFQAKLRDLGVLYSKTKRYVLVAEQMDRQSRSNIAIFKEQRDALDHVMRAILGFFATDETHDEVYIFGQIENARGHMFRAAYDALDGTGISYKFRIDDAMRGISNEAISAVYPDYWKHLIEMNNLDRTIATHRENKDEQRRKFEDLDEYCASIERVYELTNCVTEKTPAFQDWEKRNRRKNLIWAISVPVIFLLLAAFFGFLIQLYFKGRVTPTTSPAPVSSLSSPAVSPGPSP